MSVNVDDVRNNLERVRTQIAAAGGDNDRVTVVSVTKTFGADAVRAAVAAGLRSVGENYAQEATAKARELAHDDIRPQWHFIGQVQRNKVKDLATFVDVWHTVDSIRLLEEIAKRQLSARIFIQVNATDDPNRGGCDWSEIDAIAERAIGLGAVVQGLMGVGPQGEPEQSRPFFRRLGCQNHRR